MKKEQSLPAKLDEQVRTSGLELTEAQTIASNYAPFFERIAEKESQVKNLEKGNALHVDMAKRIRIDLGRICSEIELQKKKDKEAVLIRGRFVDGLFNAANGYGRLTQETAKEVEDHFERMEAERIAKLKSMRIEILAPHVDNPEMFQVELMSEEAFQNLVEGQKLAKIARVEAERKAEQERIEREAAEEAERERVRLENERLKAEAEAREIEIQKERAKVEAERQAAEKARLEAERKAHAEREAAVKEKARIQAEAEAKLKAEIQAREKAEAEIQAAKFAEQKRLEAEKLAAKKAAAAPDKDKLIAWVNSLSAPEFKIKDAEAKLISDELISKFNGFKSWALKQVETL
jgi:colicin import membrane protein